MNEPSASPQPLIWLVIGDKPGDNAQIQIIADALNLPYQIRSVLPKKEFVLGKPRFDASLYHLDLQRSDILEPPWPDLILTIGRRAAMAALWIQDQSRGHSKIVLLGRPKKWMERFSLVIVPSQYRMPDESKILHLDLPLMRSNEAAIASAAENWRDRLEALPENVTAILIGGQTKPFLFDADTAKELLQQARKSADNGFLYLVTSRRTPPDVIEALKNNLPDNARLYCWSPESDDNPYLALLARANRFIVTGDSVSMLIEVARLAKPLAIFPLPLQKGIGPHLQQLLGTWLHGGDSKNILPRMLRGLGNILYRLGLAGYSRDLTAIHQILYDKGLASPIEKGFSSGGKKPADELSQVVKRVLQLVPPT